MNDPHSTTPDDRFFDAIAQRVRRAEAAELASIEERLAAADFAPISPDQVTQIAAAAAAKARETSGTTSDGSARLADSPPLGGPHPSHSNQPSGPTLLHPDDPTGSHPLKQDDLAAPSPRITWRHRSTGRRGSRAALWFVSFCLLVALLSMVWPGTRSQSTLPYELALKVLSTDSPPMHKVSAMGRVTHFGTDAIHALRGVLGPDRNPAPTEPLVEAVRAALDDIRAATEDGPIWVGPMPDDPIMSIREAIATLNDAAGPPDWQLDAARTLKRFVPIGIYLARSARGIDAETRVGSTQTILHLRDVLGK